MCVFVCVHGCTILCSQREKCCNHSISEKMEGDEDAERKLRGYERGMWGRKKGGKEGRRREQGGGGTADLDNNSK